MCFPNASTMSVLALVKKRRSAINCCRSAWRWRHKRRRSSMPSGASVSKVSPAFTDAFSWTFVANTRPPTKGRIWVRSATDRTTPVADTDTLTATKKAATPAATTAPSTSAYSTIDRAFTSGRYKCVVLLRKVSGKSCWGMGVNELLSKRSRECSKNGKLLLLHLLFFV